MSTKPLHITFLLFFLTVTSGLSAGSAGSLSFSGSYSLRAYGTEANYWNPANLVYPVYYQGELFLINSGIDIDNNALSIRKFNDINGTYLTEKDKKNIVDGLKKYFTLHTDISHTLAGIHLPNIALSIRGNLYARGRLSSQYVKLLLFGNDYDRTYEFTRKDNHLEVLGYIDLTTGLSPYTFYLGDYEVHSGIALSFLYGVGIITTEDYSGILLINDDGIKIEQQIVLKNGTDGFGMKSLIGFRSEINENLTVGLSIDNVGGFIHWTGQTERRTYTAAADSVYIIDLDEDFFESEELVEETGSFTTGLPIITRLAAIYHLYDFNISVDWKQGYVNTVLTDKTPEISMGAEYYIKPQIPVRIGFSPGLGSDRYSFSYGSGWFAKNYDLEIGLKTIGSLIPSNYLKGIGLGITSRWRF